jgi:hypothetical protein
MLLRYLFQSIPVIDRPNRREKERWAVEEKPWRRLRTSLLGIISRSTPVISSSECVTERGKNPSESMCGIPRCLNLGQSILPSSVIEGRNKKDAWRKRNTEGGYPDIHILVNSINTSDRWNRRRERGEQWKRSPTGGVHTSPWYPYFRDQFTTERKERWIVVSPQKLRLLGWFQSQIFEMTNRLRMSS